MEVGITLNDTVRDFSLAVEKSHDLLIESYNKSKDNSSYDLTDVSEDASMDEVESNQVDTTIKRSILDLSVKKDPFLITKLYEFADEAEYDDFLYGDFAFEIFAKGELTYAEAMTDFNQLYHELVSMDHSVTVFSQERSFSKSATLQFLSLNKFQGNNIKFLYNYSKAWELYDLIITANPFLIATKPKDKICFKINTSLNNPFDGDESFDDLYDLLTFFRENKN